MSTLSQQMQAKMTMRLDDLSFLRWGLMQFYTPF